MAARLWHSEAQSRPHPMQEGRRVRIRADASGMLVAQFFFPLAMLKPRDRLRKEQDWQAKRDRDAVLNWMSVMRGCGVMMHRDLLPLTGCRPLVRCIRYSTTEPDSTAGWGKVAVDCMQPPGIRTYTLSMKHPSGFVMKRKVKARYGGLAIISSDSPRETDVVEWWEPAPRKKGFCVIEVWTGAKHGKA